MKSLNPLASDMLTLKKLVTPSEEIFTSLRTIGINKNSLTATNKVFKKFPFKRERSNGKQTEAKCRQDKYAV